MVAQVTYTENMPVYASDQYQYSASFIYFIGVICDTQEYFILLMVASIMVGVTFSFYMYLFRNNMH